MKMTLKCFGEVIVKDEFTIGDMLHLSKLDKEQQMIEGVALALISPKKTVEELKELPFGCIDDLVKIFETVSNAQRDT